ncbi:MAG: hypothetical protein ACXABU_15315 [Candidatus Hodarchaeales archaeon]|jgi:hypothetical protein
MISRKYNIFLFFLGLLLISSIFLPGKGTNEHISSTIPIPSVGLIGTWVSDAGYNETVEIVDENTTHFFIEFYPDSPTPMSSTVSKDVYIDHSYLQGDLGGWGGWISVDGLTIGENVTLGTMVLEVVGIDNLTLPLGTFPVYIANTTDDRSYMYHTSSGLLLGYHNYEAPGGEFHYLLTTNGDLTADSDDIDIPFIGFRAVYLYADDNGTILLNETILITGENSSHYFADMFTDGSLVDNSFISKAIWMDRVYKWTFGGGDFGWPIWINVTSLTLGENITLGWESYEVVDKVHISVPVGNFEVWNVSRPLDNRTYWYEVNLGLLVAYASSDEYHYLDDTNAFNWNETTTTVITTTAPETTTPGTETSTTEPETTDPIMENTTTTFTEGSTSSEPDTTTEDGDSSTTEDSTSPSISPGFSLPIVLTTFGIFYWIFSRRK